MGQDRLRVLEDEALNREFGPKTGKKLNKNYGMNI
jgi:hypothetical protein